MSDLFEKGCHSGREIEKDKIKWTRSVLSRLLTKRGKYWFCNCPFHEEVTPSCVFDPMEDNFFCFSCEQSGDGYKLAQKLDTKEI